MAVATSGVIILPNITKTASYTYNPDGSVATLTYPSARVITYSYDLAAHAVSAVDSANNINYATAATYAPQGALASLTNNTNISSTYIFNARLQPCWMYSTTGTPLPPTTTQCTGTATTANLLDLKYNFSFGVSDNGNVMGVTNNRDNTRSQNFTYDPLNRIASAQTQTTGVTIPNSNCWGLTFGYDPWGNLLNSTVSGPAGCGEPLPLSIYATSNNQMSTSPTQLAGYCYDSAGNLLLQATCPTSNPVYTYSYDAENHMTSTAGVTYTYDGDGKRVQKSGGKIYWYGMAGDALEETDLLGNTNNSTFNEFIFFNGQRIARRDYQNNVFYYFADHLGTARVQVQAGQTNPCYDADFYPFGGERIVTDTCDSAYKFTGKERDSESGLDNFGARYNSSSMGRFMSPDPLLNSGRPWDPQTWNRYAYARNNALNMIDPTGLYDLVNNCNQDDKKCNKQFQQHAKDLKNGLADLQKKVDKMKDGPEKQRLQAALTVLGTEGDHNGVNATFGKLAGDAAAETKFSSNDIGQLSATVTLDPRKIGSTNEYAIDAAHEGTHIEDTVTQAVNDYIAHGSLAALSDFSREYRGYQTSIFAASALGMNSFSRSFEGANYVLWNGSWAQVDRNITNFVTKFHDQNGKPDHPETTPHNPWPN